MNALSIEQIQYRLCLYDRLHYSTKFCPNSKTHRFQALLRKQRDLASHAMKEKTSTNAIIRPILVDGIIGMVSILNFCSRNVTEAFMADGIADETDLYALAIHAGRLKQLGANPDILITPRDMRKVEILGMEMLGIYVRQFWARWNPGDPIINHAIEVRIEALEKQTILDSRRNTGFESTVSST